MASSLWKIRKCLDKCSSFKKHWHLFKLWGNKSRHEPQVRIKIVHRPQMQVWRDLWWLWKTLILMQKEQWQTHSAQLCKWTLAQNPHISQLDKCQRTQQSTQLREPTTWWCDNVALQVWKATCMGLHLPPYPSTIICWQKTCRDVRNGRK